MPTPSHVDPRRHLAAFDPERLGYGPLAASLLNTVHALRPGAAVGVHGAPGAGKQHFLLHCAQLLEANPHTQWCWYNPWLHRTHGHLLAGLVESIAQQSRRPAAHDHARALVADLKHLSFGGEMPTSSKPPVVGQPDPVTRVRRGFRDLVREVAGAGHLVVLIEDLDPLNPDDRLLLLQGIRLIGHPQAPVRFLIAVGAESALEAVRSTAGGSKTLAAQGLGELLELSLTVPLLNPNRIEPLLVEHLGAGAERINMAFGEEGVATLARAVTQPALGMPRVLERLAGRAMMLAEFALATGRGRPLLEVEWVWIVVSERWPRVRRHILLGRRGGWDDLVNCARQLQPSSNDTPAGASEAHVLLREEPLLAEYLRSYGAELSTERDVVYEIETLQMSAGL